MKKKFHTSGQFWLLAAWCGRASWVFEVARKREMRNAHRILVDKLRENTVAKYKHVGENVFFF